MRRLTPKEIERFASRRGARRIAVENFLTTFPTDIGLVNNIHNLRDDAISYGWNEATIKAILEGLKLAVKECE